MIESRAADDRPERLSDLAVELARLSVDVFVTDGDAAALSAQRAAKTIPVVMATSADPTGTGMVARLARPGGIHTHRVLRDTERAASDLGVTLQRQDVPRPWELERAFEAVLGQADALRPVEDQVTIAACTRIVEFAALSRLPAVYGLRDFVEAGGLLAYGTDRRDLARAQQVLE